MAAKKLKDVHGVSSASGGRSAASMNALELIDEAIANVKANAGEDGLSPQQQIAVTKLEGTKRLLVGTQTKPTRAEE